MAVVGIAIVAVAMLAARRSPYAFLERYRPIRETVDLNRLYDMMPPPSRPRRMPKCTLLVFRFEDARAVLAEIKAELTPARGFVARDMLAPALIGASKTSSEDEAWVFSKGGPPVPDESLEFCSGPEAALARDEWEHGPRYLPRPLIVPSCVVLITRKDNWLDTATEALRGFLHL